MQRAPVLLIRPDESVTMYVENEALVTTVRWRDDDLFYRGVRPDGALYVVNYTRGQCEQTSRGITETYPWARRVHNGAYVALPPTECCVIL